MGVNAFYFGLNDAKVAVWNNPANYGSAVDVESVQLFGIEVDLESGELEGDDIITDSHAKVQAANIRMRFAFKDLDVLEVLTGVTNTESGAASENMIFARDDMPYFAICGVANATSGGGDVHIFVPKVKFLENFGLSMEKGSYIIPEMAGRAHYEGATYGILKIIKHGTAQAVTIPPT